MPYLVVAVVFLVPLAAVAATGRRVLAVLVGLVLAVAEWIFAILDGSDPTRGGEFHGAELVFLTFMFAVLGFLIWCAGVAAGDVLRKQLRGK